MNKLCLIFLLLCLNYCTNAQLYKAELVCIKENESFKSITSVGYLDYNTKKRYVELAFRDTVYFYKILQTNKPRDRRRFVVWFKKTDDNMLWNTTDEGNYVFGFIIDGETFWFRELTNPPREEYDKFIVGKPRKIYK
ncbi:MAG: hypothetical protein JKY53_04565 [Flavobacteriales bacterium]|nr:hypothetical protein [Flavobacteriales bacterium]